MRRSTIAGCVVGDDLHTAVVSPFMRSARCGPVLRDFCSMAAGDAARLLRELRGSGRFVLVCPSQWCAVRTVELAIAQWSGARSDLIASIDSLLPLSPNDAQAGAIGLADGGTALVAAKASVLQPWIDALQNAGVVNVDVVSPQMAALGLGLHSAQHAAVVEFCGAAALQTTLRDGLPVQVAVPVRRGDIAQDASMQTVVLPSGSDEQNVPSHATLVEPWSLAAASILAQRVATGVYHPIVGRSISSARRWIPIAAAAMVAVVLLAASGPVQQARFSRKADAAHRGIASLRGAYEEAIETRQSIKQYTTLLEAGIAPSLSKWHSVLPSIVQSHAAMGKDGVLREVTVEGDRLVLRGDTADATRLLTALEDQPAFAQAEMTAPPGVSMSHGDRGWRSFRVKAQIVESNPSQVRGQSEVSQ